MIDPKKTRAELEARLATLTARHERMEAHQHREGRDIPTDWDDRLNYVENDALVDTLDEHTVREIRMIRVAIERIDADTWTECSRCGGEIADARLHALPMTTVCTPCAESLESHGQH
jgi:DnaK suppressor protein